MTKWILIVCIMIVTKVADASECKGMQLSLVDGGCVCPIGEDWKYGRCVKNGLPEFAIHNDKGGWYCINGYVKKGARCHKQALFSLPDELNSPEDVLIKNCQLGKKQGGLCGKINTIFDKATHTKANNKKQKSDSL